MGSKTNTKQFSGEGELGLKCLYIIKKESKSNNNNLLLLLLRRFSRVRLFVTP